MGEIQELAANQFEEIYQEDIDLMLKRGSLFYHPT
jgi:hypothetical protein